jgi:hypothetical protein
MTPLVLTDPMSRAHTRLLVLCVLLLGAMVVTQDDGAAAPFSDAVTSVYEQPPAYLHPPTAIGFDLSGLRSTAPGGVEAALVASAEGVMDLEARAHTHMSLAVYYKLNGQGSRAAAEKKKGDYWRRVAKFVDEASDAK